MGGKTETTERSKTNPAKWLMPHISSALGGAQNLYQSGHPTFAPFSPTSAEALARIEARALTGSPVFNAANQTLTDTIQGNYLTPDANPYLRRNFNAAAQSVQDQINAEFSKAGRYGSGRHAQTMAKQLGDMAASMYGQAYNQERGRQMQATGMAPQFANQDFTDLQQMQAAGQAWDAMAKQIVDDPYTRIQRYVSTIRGVPQGTESYGKTTQTSTPGPLDIIGTAGSIASTIATSDRRLKKDVKPVKGEEVLERFRGLPVKDFRYRQCARRAMNLPEARTGPMADDYARLFGGDGATIDMADALGNVIAAIKALDARTRRSPINMR